jgi:hypothetical protein
MRCVMPRDWVAEPRYKGEDIELILSDYPADCRIAPPLPHQKTTEQNERIRAENETIKERYSTEF